MGTRRRRLRGSPSWRHWTTWAPHPSVILSFLFAFLSPTFTTSRVLGRLFAELLSRAPSFLVMSSVLSPVVFATRRSSPLNNTRRPLRRPARETPLVSRSRVSERTRRLTLEISFTSRKMVTSNPSRVSLPLLLCRSTLVSSSLDTHLSSSAALLRLHAR